MYHQPSGCGSLRFLVRNSLSNQSFHEGRSSKGPVILVGNRPVHVTLKEGEHGEPNACPPALLVSARVGQSVVVQEKASCDVEGDEHVDGVVLMSRQNEEDSKQV